MLIVKCLGFGLCGEIGAISVALHSRRKIAAVKHGIGNRYSHHYSKPRQNVSDVAPHVGIVGSQFLAAS